MFGATLRAPQAGKTSLKPATTQKLLNGTDYNRAQGSRAGLEAFFVASDVTVKVVFKELIERSLLGMSWPILRDAFRNHPAGGIVGVKGTVFGCIGPNNDRLVAQWHGREQTSCGCRAALNLTAPAGFEPKYSRWEVK